jgi:hypothetical protein
MKYSVYIAFVVLSLAGTPLHAEDFNPSNQHKSSGPEVTAILAIPALKKAIPNYSQRVRHELQKEQRMCIGLLLHNWRNAMRFKTAMWEWRRLFRHQLTPMQRSSSRGLA